MKLLLKGCQQEEGTYPSLGFIKKESSLCCLRFLGFLLTQSHSAVKDSSPCCVSVGFVVREHRCLPVAVFMSENSDGVLNLLGPSLLGILLLASSGRWEARGCFPHESGSTSPTL